MDVKFINPFVMAVKRVFETMVHTKVTVGKPHMKSDEGPLSDVSGIIGFSGEAAGCVVISFTMDVATKVASAFACTEINKDHPDFADAIGELANMVAGNAKMEFADLNIKISLPSVVIGDHFKVSNSKTTPRIIIPCNCDHGTVIVEVAMEISKISKGTPAAPVAVGA